MDRITTWLESRLPGHRVETAQRGGKYVWIIRRSEDAPASYLEVPEEYIDRDVFSRDEIIELLQREGLPARVEESDEGVARLVSTERRGQDQDLILRSYDREEVTRES